jgi:glycosyltransferase involved in cell wall biosynthesis
VSVRVAVIIPALNEEDCIGAVVREVRAAVETDVFVVDNGSTDRTAEAARAAGAEVVAESRRGYGYACAAGVAAAGDRFDVLVFMDGDGSDDPREMGLLLEPLQRGAADLVAGSRVLGPTHARALPPHQRWGNALTVALIRVLYGRRLTDLSPFRAIRRPVLASLGMQEMTYGWPTEMLVKCARRGYRIVEVPVTARPRRAGKSKISGTVRGTILAAYYLLGVTLKVALFDERAP